MKYRIETGEVVEAKCIHSRSEGTASWQTWQVPDGRVFQAYNDRWPRWVDEDGILDHSNCGLKSPNDRDVKCWAGSTYVSPADQRWMRESFCRREGGSDA